MSRPLRCWHCGKPIPKGRKDFCSIPCQKITESEEAMLDEPKEGFVCGLCGKTITEREHSLGRSICCGKKVESKEHYTGR